MANEPCWLGLGVMPSDFFLECSQFEQKGNGSSLFSYRADPKTSVGHPAARVLVEFPDGSGKKFLCFFEVFVYLAHLPQSLERVSVGM